ncbi:hypothetical protein K8R43_06780 [archaeon]|nr:hypothetical protein [archaeon]
MSKERLQSKQMVKQMVDYTTLKAEEIKYGSNNFIEVARKEIDSNQFISLSKGYFTPDGQRRYKTGLGFPDEGGIAKFLAESILQMSEDTGEPKAELEEENPEEVQADEEGSEVAQEEAVEAKEDAEDMKEEAAKEEDKEETAKEEDKEETAKEEEKEEAMEEPTEESPAEETEEKKEE